MKELENFAVNLKAKRKELGLSRKALEDKSGVSQWTITRWECYEALYPSMYPAILVAKALGCTLDELCGIQAPKSKE